MAETMGKQFLWLLHFISIIGNIHSASAVYIVHANVILLQTVCLQNFFLGLSTSDYVL